MASDVVMPKMGYDMEEGTILRWLKAEGDTVAKGDILAEIETGKVTIEMEAFDEGVLRAVIASEGETVPVGQPIAIIGTADEEIELPARAGDGATPGSAPDEAARAPSGNGPGGAAETSTNGRAPMESAASAGRPRSSPLARRVAADHGIDLARLAPGSGPHGRVVRDDVQAAIEAGGAVMAPVGVATQVPETRREALSSIRRTIARRLSDSWTAAPHIFVTMAVEMDEALAIRAQLNAVAPEGAPKLSLNDLIVKATARALREQPLMNVSWDDGERVVHGHVNIGVAVALDDGLVTVTVPDADQRRITDVATEIRDKAGRARAGKLTPDDFAVPSTFTISNMGMYGVEAFTAIINPPEAGILAVGAAAPEPVVRDAEVVVRTVMRLTVSADHRVVDGAAAAVFLGRLKELLEHPAAILA